MIFTVRNEVAKVMFLHLFVILSTGGTASVYAGIPHSPSPGPPGPGTPPPGPGTPPEEQTTTVADGTHPTGMHSCYCKLNTSEDSNECELFYRGVSNHIIPSSSSFIQHAKTFFSASSQKIPGLTYALQRLTAFVATYLQNYPWLFAIPEILHHFL